MDLIQNQPLESDVRTPSNCQTTGRHLHVRKLSSNEPLRTFNEEIQLDYVDIVEGTNCKILHIKDSNTGLANANTLLNREMKHEPRHFGSF